MGWETVAVGTVSSEGVQGDISRTLEELPLGTLGIFRLEAWGLGPIFDAPGVELVVQGIFNAQGLDAQVIDCWGEGWNTAYIRFQGSPILVVPLLVAIAPVLYALGFLVIAVSVALLIWKAAAGAPGAFLALAILGGAVLGGIYLARRQPVRARR